MKTFATWAEANHYMIALTLRGVYCTQPLLVDGVWRVRHA
jgi:hypothetical protein